MNFVFANLFNEAINTGLHSIKERNGIPLVQMVAAGDIVDMVPPRVKLPLASKPPEYSSDEKIPYPKSVFFIISNEFCERFSYYGMRTILSLYLTQALKFSENTSTLIYHTFVMLCYFTPLLGGIMADSWLGKFKTILYVSFFYAFGNIVLSISSISVLNIPHEILSLIGLFLIASGTGGIKPCVSSFGGDQFVLPQQELQLQRFFSIFYFSINAGSVISCFLTPLLREEVKCFGQDNCYPLAFGIPAILMCVAVVIFVCGKPLYKIKKPSGNIALDVAKCVGHALIQKTRVQKFEKKNHWLDYAAPKFSLKLIEDTKILMKIIFLFTPTIFFWALYEQQGSKWTFQANNMDGSINDWFVIQPDQMQTVNPVLCLLFIPIFQSIIYPFLYKIRVITTPLQKLSWGGLFAALAFLISGFLELKIQKDKAILPGSGQSQLRLYNTFNCPIHLQSEDFHINRTLGALDTTELSFNVNNASTMVKFNASLDKSCSTVNENNFTNEIEIRMAEISSYMFIKPSLTVQILNITGSDEVKKSTQGFPKLKIFYENKDSVDVSLTGPTNPVINVKNYQSVTTEIKKRGIYSVSINGQNINGSLNLQPGGFYTYLITRSGNNLNGKLFTITKPNSVNLMWQLPQYFVITFAEIMFSITGLEFSFTQSPESMKSVISSIWLLTDSLGNIIVLIVAGMKIFENQAYEFFLFAILMTIVMFIFILIAMRYKYVESDGNKNEEPVQSRETRT